MSTGVAGALLSNPYRPTKEAVVDGLEPDGPTWVGVWSGRCNSSGSLARSSLAGADFAVGSAAVGVGLVGFEPRAATQPPRATALWIGLFGTLVRHLGTWCCADPLGFCAYSPLLGMGVGLLLGSLLLSGEWRGVRPKRPDPVLLSRFLTYGLPLTGTFALDNLIETGGRFMVAHYQGEANVGVYAAGYDLIQNAMTLFLFVVNLAAFPIVLRALEHHGPAFAKEKLRQNGLLVLALGLPAATGIALLAPNIAHTVLGSQFNQAQSIMPLVGAAMLIAGRPTQLNQQPVEVLGGMEHVYDLVNIQRLAEVFDPNSPI